MDNVIKFPNKQPIFNQELRQKLEDGVKEFTEKPEETVTRVEQVICAWIVLGVRRFAESMGKKLGEKVMSKVSNE